MTRWAGLPLATAAANRYCHASKPNLLAEKELAGSGEHVDTLHQPLGQTRLP